MFWCAQTHTHTSLMYFPWTQASPWHFHMQTPQPIDPSNKLTHQPSAKENTGGRRRWIERKDLKLLCLLHSNGNIASDPFAPLISYQTLLAHMRLKKKNNFEFQSTNHSIIIMTKGVETRSLKKKQSQDLLWNIWFPPTPLPFPLSSPFNDHLGMKKLFSCCQWSQFLSRESSIPCMLPAGRHPRLPCLVNVAILCCQN